MSRDKTTILVEYISSISEDKLKFFYSRLKERISGDLAEVLDELSKDKKIDGLFSSAASADGVFDLLDEFAELVEKHSQSKNISLKSAVPAS